MKSLILFVLIFLISCESTEDSNTTVDFYKCLLLDSDTVYNDLNTLFESIKSLDPVKFATTFTSIYPAIMIEVNRCKKELNIVDDNKAELRKTSEDSNAALDFIFKVIEILNTYVVPFLKTLGIDFKGLCNQYLPDSFVCMLLN